jgi:hypothetical protein
VTVRVRPHQIEDDGRRLLRFGQVQRAETILDTHSRKSSRPKRGTVRIT